MPSYWSAPASDLTASLGEMHVAAESNVWPTVPPLSATPSASPNIWRPRVLVLGPGGTKGFSLLGALVALDDAGYLAEVDTYCGVSVGSAISLLLVVGYKPREIISLAASVDLFGEVRNEGLNWSAMAQQHGLLSMEPLRHRLQELVAAKLGRGVPPQGPTLQQLYERTGLVYCSVTRNFDRQGTEYLSVETVEPGELSPAIDATIVSMALPGIFYKALWKGMHCGDGALGDPYPVLYFDDGYTPVLGLYIEQPPHGTSDPLSYINSVIESGVYSGRGLVIDVSSPMVRHLPVICTNQDTLGLTHGAKEKALMVYEGLHQAQRWLAGQVTVSGTRARRREAPYLVRATR
jgi:predicted acylesterase/phospholipase RssA